MPALKTGEVPVTEEASSEGKRALVQRVVASPLFAKSERLSSFLVYVCEMSLRGKAADLNEQRIGIAVFGRRPDYDATADGIVRTHASRLRQKLEAHFNTDGASEPWRIRVPRGGYVPFFEEQPTDAPAKGEKKQQELAVTSPEVLSFAAQPQADFTPSFQLDQPLTGAIPTQHASARALWSRDLTLALAAVLLVGGLAIRHFLLRHHTHTVSAQAAVGNPLWSRVLCKDRPTLLVPADSGLVLYDALSTRETDLREYLRGSYRSPTGENKRPEEAVKLSTANSRYTSIVDLEMAVGLSRLAMQQSSDLHIRFARDLRPNDLKSVNAVLSGAAEANPWVQLFEPQMNFVMQHDSHAHVHRILNRAPARGEPTHWESALADPEHRVYGVIAFLPNLAGNGDALILEGTSMSGTEAAWDFARDDAILLPFLQRIRNADGSLPHFELLVTTNNLDASAVRIEPVAWRTQR